MAGNFDRGLSQAEKDRLATERTDMQVEGQKTKVERLITR